MQTTKKAQQNTVSQPRAFDKNLCSLEIDYLAPVLCRENFAREIEPLVTFLHGEGFSYLDIAEYIEKLTPQALREYCDYPIEAQWVIDQSILSPGKKKPPTIA